MERLSAEEYAKQAAESARRAEKYALDAMHAVGQVLKENKELQHLPRNIAPHVKNSES